MEDFNSKLDLANRDIESKKRKRDTKLDDKCREVSSKYASMGYAHASGSMLKEILDLYCENVELLSNDILESYIEIFGAIKLLSNDQLMHALQTNLRNIISEHKNYISNDIYRSQARSRDARVDEYNRRTGSIIDDIIVKIQKKIILDQSENNINQVYNMLTVNASSINSSPIQQGGQHANMTQSVSYHLEDLDNLRRLVDVFENNLNDLSLDAPAKRKAAAQIATIKAQLEDEPDPVIVKQAGHTLRNITEGAISSLVATAVQPSVWSWVESFLRVFQ